MLGVDRKKDRMDLKDQPQSKPVPDLTEFGMCVYKLMLSRGYKTVGRLAADMREDSEVGFKITRQAISNYTTGKRNVPAPFVVRLADILDLTEKERRELAWAFAYGQGQQRVRSKALSAFGR
jgi:hypothetical protein